MNADVFSALQQALPPLHATVRQCTRPLPSRFPRSPLSSGLCPLPFTFAPPSYHCCQLRRPKRPSAPPVKGFPCLHRPHTTNTHTSPHPLHPRPNTGHRFRPPRMSTAAASRSPTVTHLRSPYALCLHSIYIVCSLTHILPSCVRVFPMPTHG